MTTTAYDTATILRQNVADLERELQRQRERADKAEAKLKAAMEQEPVAWLSAENYKRICPGLGKTVAIKMNKVKPDDVPLYSAHFHAAPAPAVQDEWREVMAGLIAIAEKKGKKQGSPNHCHQRPGIWDDDNGPVLSGKPCAECAMYDKARTLLQSGENHD